MAEHALVITIGPGGSPEDAEALADDLEAHLAAKRGMEFDGIERGPGGFTIYCYARNADRLWDEVLPLVSRGSFPPGSSALKRYGGPNAAGVRIELAPDGIGPSTDVPKQRAPKKNYRDGDWFLAPIEPGRYVAGRVARSTGHGVVAYFFAPPVDEPPALDDLDRLTPDDAYTYLNFSDVGLRSGEWPILGASHHFEPAEWPLAPFENYVESGGRAWLEIIEYDPRNLDREASVTRGDARQRGRYPEAGISGAGAALAHLRSRLPR